MGASDGATGELLVGHGCVIEWWRRLSEGCADYRFDPETFDVTTILAEGEEGTTTNLYGAAFLATADGRLVVMGDAERGDLPSGRVIFGVHAP